MKKRILIPVIAAVSALVILFIGVTTAYFTEVEVKDNNITIGKVSIELDEGDFDKDKTYDVVPGSRLPKAPKLTNDGNKDEFVFLRITVPTDAVTLLNESGANKGKPMDGLLNVPQQLFRLMANETPARTDVPATAGKDIGFSYHYGEENLYGWILLGSRSVTESGKTFDEYVFGYNKKMEPGNETVTLFDEVQLKSFIDSEHKGETSVGVFAYGLQSDYLKPSGTVDMEAAYLSEQTLQAIYTIVKNKAGLS